MFMAKKLMNGRRGVDHVYFVMPNQQYSLTAKDVLIVRIIFDSPTYIHTCIHTYIHIWASIKKCWSLCNLAVFRYLSRTADVDNCTVPLNSSMPVTFAVLSSIAMLFNAQNIDVSSHDSAAHTLRSLLQVRDLSRPENSRRSLSNAVLIDTTFVFKIDSCNTNVHDCSLHAGPVFNTLRAGDADLRF